MAQLQLGFHQTSETGLQTQPKPDKVLNLNPGLGKEPQQESGCNREPNLGLGPNRYNFPKYGPDIEQHPEPGP